MENLKDMTLDELNTRIDNAKDEAKYKPDCENIVKYEASLLNGMCYWYETECGGFGNGIRRFCSDCEASHD